MRRQRLPIAWVILCVVLQSLSPACGSESAGDRFATGSSFRATPDVWEALRSRQLRLPVIDAGAACPVASVRRVSADFGPALGPGPLYPVFGTGAVFRYGYGDERGGFQGEWGGEKVLWVADASYEGPALVRGRQLDGPNQVRFGHGVDPAGELRLDEAMEVRPSPSGWRNWPSYTRIRAPGCYAYQVDTRDGSYVVVFRAEPVP
jgi:hypothetical protein